MVSTKYFLVVSIDISASIRLYLATIEIEEHHGLNKNSFSAPSGTRPFAYDAVYKCNNKRFHEDIGHTERVSGVCRNRGKLFFVVLAGKNNNGRRAFGGLAGWVHGLSAASGYSSEVNFLSALILRNSFGELLFE